MDVLSQSIEKKQKTAEDNAELIQNLLSGVENLGDNLKHIQKEMEFRKIPEFQEAEEEYTEMNGQLQAEVPPFVLVISGPLEVLLTSSISAPQILVSLSVPVSTSMGILSEHLLREMQVWVLAHCKPYPGATVIIAEGVIGGFYFGRRQAQDQAAGYKSAQFSVGTTNVPHAVNVTIGMGEKNENVQKQTRSAPAAILEPQCEPRWYICPFDGRKKYHGSNLCTCTNEPSGEDLCARLVVWE